MNDVRFIRFFVAVAIFALGIVCGNCWGSIVRIHGGVDPAAHLSRLPASEHIPDVVATQDPEPEPSGATEEELEAAIVLARYGVNEAGFRAHADTLMLWQVAETHADNLADQVRWLRRHSRCVVSRRPPREWPPGNCRWSRYLRADGQRPRNWPRRLSWASRSQAWADQYEFALEVVSGRVPERPCAGSPQTWDGRTWMAGRLEAGFSEVPCSSPWTGEPLANVAYRFPDWRETRNPADPSASIAPQLLNPSALALAPSMRGRSHRPF